MGRALVALLGGLLVVLTACGSGAPGSAPAAPPPPVRVDVTPATNATDVAPRAGVAATTEGTFTDVTLTAAPGGPVAGTLSPDRKRWTPDGPLAYGATYTWGGTATAPGGGSSPVTGSFTTVAPGETVRATLNIGDDREVGIGAPITVQFSAPVEDKAAAERALEVRTSVPTEGSWAWLPDQDGGSRAHWRPKEYWKPGTKVDVAADLLGVPFGGGAWGREDLTTSFTIGRAQIVRADVNSFRMVVERDGAQVMDVPASYGLDSDPNRTTRSGIHVVSEKFTNKRMTSAQYGYDLVERWAVRISNNGEFIHANPASAGAQGSSNVTHGCINLSENDAKAFYDSAMYGDPVEVTGSGVDYSERDGDIYDWAIPWDQWQGMSAL
ncbi:lipoprotein-anchoring transpeptidase ErfK/SrfK [Actinomycetospora succinea]|uniref:Lipoprotein-anchoring transpeptidase ErfK/SrfK n=1 Tax=Actinomycetospora succinea TaxID=663603 RepID=A0A4R6UIU8_9PSEU|nr:Ig-like domain-containing protein [Actinomycetospora succinea]TDQ46741.1 lipoprotein-anchoring transpeptidase ErfK/SrfK [Actinomycetospora succinea]